MAGLGLFIATVRSKTAQSGGRLRDRSAEYDEDPYPGIGLDDETPLGDTPEHSDAVDDRGARPARSAHD
jgi:hypothetical protein